MTDADELLVRILGTVDGIFLPVRNWAGELAGARYLALAEYAARGVPFRANARNEAVRKAGERELVALAAAGLLVVQRARTKFPGCRLTVAGEVRARALADLPNRDGARAFLAAVAGIAAGYVMGVAPEVDFYPDGGPGAGAWDAGAPREERQAIAGLENVALPAAHAGWVAARSTQWGHVCYTVTAAGRAELEGPTTDPEGPLPAADPEAATVWAAARDAKLAELAAVTGLRELGQLPLPSGAFLARTGGGYGPVAVRKAS